MVIFGSRRFNARYPPIPRIASCDYPGMLVSTVEILGYEPVFGGVSREIGVQKIDRDSPRAGLVMHSDHVMLPDAHLHVPAFDPDGYFERKRFHERARVEVGVYLFLLAQKGLYSE